LLLIIIKSITQLWSPFAQQGWEGSLTQAEALPYCTRALYRESSDHVSQDFSARSTDEDQVMLAFFDTLVQHELESWSTVDILVAGHLPSAIFRERLSAAQNLYQRNLTGHYGCVNALEFSSGGQFLASGKWRYLLISFRPPS